MHTQPNSLAEVERRVLRALVHSALNDSPVSDFQFPISGLNALRTYHWSEALHHALFDVLAELQGADPELIREQLPARLTRRGFPDFDLAWFQPQALKAREIARWIDRLVGQEFLTKKQPSRRPQDLADSRRDERERER